MTVNGWTTWASSWTTSGTIEFFRELGLELEGRAMVEGEWAGRVTGLGDQRVEIAMMRTPDGHGRLELSRFLDAACGRRSPERPGERSRLPTCHVRCGRHRRDARPAPQARRAARRRSGPVRRRVSALLHPRARRTSHRARPRTRLSADSGRRGGFESGDERNERCDDDRFWLCRQPPGPPLRTMSATMRAGHASASRLPTVLYAADHADLAHPVLDLGGPIGNEAVLAVERLGARVRVGYPQCRRLLRIDDPPRAVPIQHPCRGRLHTRRAHTVASPIPPGRPRAGPTSRSRPAGRRARPPQRGSRDSARRSNAALQNRSRARHEARVIENCVRHEILGRSPCQQLTLTRAICATSSTRAERTVSEELTAES